MEKSLFTSFVEPELLYSRSVSVNIKRNLTSMRRHNLSVSVESMFSGLKKEVNLKISDENDPFFIYILNLSEDGFLSLKNSQGILVDFASFPRRVIELLDCCVDEQHKDNPKFILTLSIEEKVCRSTNFAQLEIVETNAFKHLSHLSLKLTAPDENDLKDYVINNFKKLKNEKKQLENTVKCVENECNDRIKSMDEGFMGKCREMEKLRNEYESSIREIELKLKFEIEKNNDLVESNARKDWQVEDLKKKIFSLEECKSTITQKMESLIRENSDSKKVLIDAESNANKSKVLVDALGQQLEENKCLVSSTQEKLDNELKRKLELMKHCENLKSEIESKNNTIESLNADMQKANEIIRKLQAETQNVHSKLDLLNKVATKQDEVVNEKENRVKKLEHDLKVCLERIMKKEDDIKTLNDELLSLRQRCEESQQQIKTNENVISWLNKKLTELQSNAGVHKSPERVFTETRTQATLNSNSKGLPEVNLVTNRKEGLTVRGRATKTIPKYVYEKNPLFVKGLNAKIVK